MRFGSLLYLTIEVRWLCQGEGAVLNAVYEKEYQFRRPCGGSNVVEDSHTGQKSARVRLCTEKSCSGEREMLLQRFVDPKSRVRQSFVGAEYCITLPSVRLLRQSMAAGWQTRVYDGHSWDTPHFPSALHCSSEAPSLQVAFARTSVASFSGLWL